MKIGRLLLLGFISMPGFFSVAQASNTQLNQTLVRIIQELNAILPLLDEARDEIKPDSRIELQIESFRGADGKKHPGLRDDVISMREALIAFINEPALAPKDIKPLALDYIGRG